MEFDAMFTCEKRDQWTNRNHWIELFVTENRQQQLNISCSDDSSNSLSRPPRCRPTKDNNNNNNDDYRRRCKRRLVQDGYVLVDNDNDNDDDTTVMMDKHRYEDLTTKLRDAITVLHQRGYPPTFVLLYDETWEFAKLVVDRTLGPTTHPSHCFTYDVLAWYVDPRCRTSDGEPTAAAAASSSAGFSPHRDRQPSRQGVPSTFHPDGQAKYVTLWTALSDATPQNSCLYVIPKPYDPGYLDGDDDDDTATDDDDDNDDDANNNNKKNNPLWKALPTKESFQNICALPRRAGQAILFTHRILHWGSRGNRHAAAANHVEPRIAISLVSSDPSFEKPYLNSSTTTTAPSSCSSSSSSLSSFGVSPLPSFSSRLLLVCAQLLIYYQRFNLSRDCIRACYEYCRDHEAELEPSYRNKVYVEFVRAMREQTTEANAKNDDAATIMSNDNDNKTSSTKDAKDGQDDSSNDESDDDAVLEAMLDAEQGGYGEFQDDYDEMNKALCSGETDCSNEGSEDDVDEEEESSGATFLFGKRSFGGGGADGECNGKKQRGNS